MPADIALVLDSSASIFPPAFNDKLMPFLKDLVSSFEISPEKVRFSLLTYGNEVNKQFVFNFDEYTDEQSLLEKLDTVRWVWGASTRTDLAVKYARKKFFSTARPDVERIEIIVTDGRTDELAIPNLNQEIALTKKDGVTIFAIGVGDKISIEDLKSMATSMKYVFNVTEYAALQEIKDILAATACIGNSSVHFFLFYFLFHCQGITESPLTDWYDKRASPRCLWPQMKFKYGRFIQALPKL